MTLRNHAATVPLIAGTAVLDLVNTVSWRGDPERSTDHLTGTAEALVWSVRAGVLSESEAAMLRDHLSPQAATVLLERLHALRDVVAAVVVPPRTDHAVARAREVVLDALTHAALTPAPGSAEPTALHWAATGLDEHSPARRLALELHLLLTRPAPVGVCADDDCRWVFLDTSRGRRRRWCDSRDCGNRHRVRVHQERSAASR